MPCCLRGMHIISFRLCYMGMQICGNLNAQNKMRDIGKGTYLVVGNSGNGEAYSVAAI